MTRVAYYMALICPRPLHTLDRVDDNKLERFKSHWLNKLVESIEHMQFQVSVALNAACEHIEALNLCIVHESMEDTASDFTDSLAPSFYEDLIHKALIVINSTIKLRSESELIFASRSWEQGVHGMTQKLREAIGSLGGSLDHLKIQILHSSTRVVREPVIRLTELLIPIIKLSRLFFNKLSGSGVHKKQLPAHTEMNSKQMKCLYGSAQDVARDVSKLLNLLYAAEVTRWNTIDTRMFSEAAGTLASRFEAPKLLFLVHVIPLIQEIDLDYYENWFATWNTQFDSPSITSNIMLDPLTIFPDSLPSLTSFNLNSPCVLGHAYNNCIGHGIYTTLLECSHQPSKLSYLVTHPSIPHMSWYEVAHRATKKKLTY
ncbi:hypothetical protein KEM48_009038 [Puccinia striiformis f. sp. tritici PST-130]|nr:hypothetical protein KEM48_009038 [Puccinia striiformis f. sp. tritici PST-130]